MKKQLLTLALVTGAFINSYAQQAYGEDFSIYNGFTEGDINGQQGWTEVNGNGTVISGYSITQDVPASATGSWMPSSPSSLKVSYTTDGLDTGAVGMCQSPILANAGQPASATTSFMILIDTDNDPTTLGSRYMLEFLDSQGAITSQISFLADGSIKVLDIVNGMEDSVTTNATWTAHEWIQITLTYNFIAHTISYNKTGEIIHQGSTLSGHNLYRFTFMQDNVPGSTAYFDDVFVFSSSTGLGVQEMQASVFSVFPNPATDKVTITNPDGRFIDSVEIIDLNGRKVKMGAFTNNAAPQINVADLAAGVYLMAVTLDNGSTGTLKIVKQ